MPFLLEVPGVVGRGVWGVWGRERRVSVARACRDIERESRRAYLWSSSTSKPALPSMRTDDEDPMLNMPMPLLSSSRALETNSKLEAFCSRADDDEGDGDARRDCQRNREAGGPEKGLRPPGSHLGVGRGDRSRHSDPPCPPPRGRDARRATRTSARRRGQRGHSPHRRSRHHSFRLGALSSPLGRDSANSMDVHPKRVVEWV